MNVGLLAVVAGAALLGGCSTSAPLERIPDSRVRDLAAAAFEAHGSWEEYQDAGALSFIVQVSGKLAESLGDEMRGHVELSPFPRSRWATKWGLVEIDRHGAVALLPPELSERIPPETAELLRATGLLLAMPMPLIASVNPPEYLGRRQSDIADTWSVVRLHPDLSGASRPSQVSVFASDATHRIERLLLASGEDVNRWVVGIGRKAVYLLSVIETVRWYDGDRDGLAGEMLAELKLVEMAAEPTERAFMPIAAPAR